MTIEELKRYYYAHMEISTESPHHHGTCRACMFVDKELRKQHDTTLVEALQMDWAL